MPIAAIGAHFQQFTNLMLWIKSRIPASMILIEPPFNLLEDGYFCPGQGTRHAIAHVHQSDTGWSDSDGFSSDKCREKLDHQAAFSSQTSSCLPRFNQLPWPCLILDCWNVIPAPLQNLLKHLIEQHHQPSAFLCIDFMRRLLRWPIFESKHCYHGHCRAHVLPPFNFQQFWLIYKSPELYLSYGPLPVVLDLFQTSLQDVVWRSVKHGAFNHTYVHAKHDNDVGDGHIGSGSAHVVI